MRADEKTRFKKGHKPKGHRPKGSVSVPMEVRKINSKMFAEMIDKHASLGPKELRAKMKDPKTTVLDLAVMRILERSALYGDEKKVNFLMERTAGKVKDVVDHTINDPMANLDFSKLTDDELETFIALNQKAKKDQNA